MEYSVKALKNSFDKKSLVSQRKISPRTAISPKTESSEILKLQKTLGNQKIGSLLVDSRRREHRNEVSGAKWTEPLGPLHPDTYFDHKTRQYKQAKGDYTGYWALAVRPGSYDVNISGVQHNTVGLKWTSYIVSRREDLKRSFVVENVPHPNVFAEGGPAVYGQVEQLYLHKDGTVMVDLSFKTFKVYTGTHESLFHAIRNRRKDNK